MKKVFIVILFLFCINVKAEVNYPEITDHEKVTIYFFWADNSVYYHDRLIYLYNHYDEYKDYIDLVFYDTFFDDNIHEFHKAVNDYFEDESYLPGEVSAPYIIIGDSYTKLYLMVEEIDDLINVALKEYQNDNYKDVVREIEKDYPGMKSYTLQEYVIKEGVFDTEKDNNNLIYVIIGVVTLLIIVIMGYLIKRRRSKVDRIN